MNKETIAEILSQLPRLFPIIAIIGVLAVLLPDSIAIRLGIQTIRSDYLGWIVIITFISFLLWSLERSNKVWSKLAARRRVRKRVEEEMKLKPRFAELRLNRLLFDCSDPEIAVLIYCLKHERDVVFLPRNDPVALALCHRSVLILPQKVADSTSGTSVVPFFMDRHIYKALKNQGLDFTQEGKTGINEWDMYIDRLRLIESDIFNQKQLVSDS